MEAFRTKGNKELKKKLLDEAFDSDIVSYIII